jgi:hypothetical protein
MSKPLEQVQLLRLEWLARLRAGKDKQIRGQFEDDKDGVCAVGLAVRILEEHGIASKVLATGYIVRKRFGMSDRMVHKIMVLNDSGKSFPEIADVLEKMRITTKRETRQ